MRAPLILEEIMKRSLLKKELRTARRERQRHKSRFRKLVIGDLTFLFFIGKDFTDIRHPNGREKYLVAHWTMNKMTREVYDAIPLDSVETGCFCMTCDCGGCHRSHDLLITPAKIQEFLLAHSVEAQKAVSRARAAQAAAKLVRVPRRRSRGYVSSR